MAFSVINSVGQDVALGFERTGEGLGFGEDGRMGQIGFENNAIAVLLSDTVKYGVNNRNSPLFKSIVHILEHYYVSLTDEELQAVAKQAGIWLKAPKIRSCHTMCIQPLFLQLFQFTSIEVGDYVHLSFIYKSFSCEAERKGFVKEFI